MGDLGTKEIFSAEALEEVSSRLRKMERELLLQGRMEDSMACAYGDFFALVVRRWLLERGTLEQALAHTLDELHAVQIAQA